MNGVAGKFIVLRAGTPKKAAEVRKTLFEYFDDIRSALKARLPKGCSLLKQSRIMNTVNRNENRESNLKSSATGG